MSHFPSLCDCLLCISPLDDICRHPSTLHHYPIISSSTVMMQFFGTASFSTVWLSTANRPFLTFSLCKKSWPVPPFDISIVFSWQISSVTAQVIYCFHFFIIFIFSIFRQWDDPRHHWPQTDLFLAVSMTGTPTFCMTCMPLCSSLCVYEEVEENLTVSVYVV